MPSDINRVKLAGIVVSCHLSSPAEGRLAAELEICTVHPGKGFGQGGRLSETTDRLRHFVRVDVSSDDPSAGVIRSILSDKSGKPLIVSVDGSIAPDGEGTVVLVRDGGLGRLDRLPLTDNNHAEVRGVARVSFSDNTASVILDCGGVGIPVTVSRRLMPALWSKISSGKYVSGDTLAFSGPVFGDRYTDGDGRIIRECALMPSSARKLSLVRTRTKGGLSV